MSTKTVGLDFAKLTLCEALDLAIFVEEEAMDRYGEFADQLEKHRTPNAARFFRFMEKNEAKHRAALAAKRKELFPSAAVTVTREMIFDIEAPEYDEARIFMSLRQALETSLHAEHKARSFFEDALTRVSSPEVRALFTELRDDEVEHQALVQREIDKLPPGVEPNPEDYADEPHNQ
jgi:rubrerythrin